MVYNGQLDIIVGVPLTENYLQQLKWSGQEDYLNADKTVWKINSVPVGYVKQVGKFQQVILVHKISSFINFLGQVVIRNAGHILPYDQPEVALAMINNFIDN